MSLAEKDAVFTLERLLQRLLDEPEVREVLGAEGVDLAVLASEVDAYLQGLRKTDDAPSRVTDPKVSRVLQSVIVLEQMSGSRRPLSSLDVLAGIVRAQDFYAAERLLAFGFGPEIAKERADAHYVAAGEEAKADLQRTQQALAVLAAKPSAGPPVAQEGDTATGVPDYRITVVSRDPKTEVMFKGAISADGYLRLLIESTPFELRFSASEIIALFESVTDGESIAVKLFSIQEDGTTQQAGGFGGQSGVIFESPQREDGSQKSGYLR